MPPIPWKRHFAVAAWTCRGATNRMIGRQLPIKARGRPMANVSHIDDHRTELGDGASLKVGDRTIEFETRKGTIGPEVIDIATLYRDTGRFTYDPGFTSTAACES